MRRNLTICAAAGAIALGAHLFQTQHSHIRPAKVRHISIYVDVSDQSDPVLLRYLDWAYRAQQRLEPKDELKIYVFAHSLELVYDAGGTADRGRFNDLIGCRLKQSSPAMRVPETRTELVFEEISRADSAPDAVLICTDGGIENLTTRVETTIRLASARWFKVSTQRRLVVAGVLQQYRRQWAGWIENLAPERCLVRGSDDAENAIRSLGEG